MHGVTGGASSLLGGGDFHHGFLSAGFTQLASAKGMMPSIGANGVGERIRNGLAAAIVGGTSSLITGGKFSNGAITGAFSRLLNDMASSQPQKQQRGAPITDEQRAMAEDGDYLGFWKSRYFDSNDPVARTALIGWGEGDLVGASWFQRELANNTWNRLESYIARNNLTVTMEQLGVELARVHVDFVMADTQGIPHLLSPKQVADYHHSVFDEYGIPQSYFGGTRFGNSPKQFRWLWCRGCDTSP